MTCPNCKRELTAEEAASGSCPGCGLRRQAWSIGVAKTSTVRVSAGDVDQVYHTLEEIPPAMREKIRQALSGPDSETIVIADERGREYIYKAVAGLPPELKKKVLGPLEEPSCAAGRAGRPAWLPWAAAAILSLLALVLLWMWFGGVEPLS